MMQHDANEALSVQAKMAEAAAYDRAYHPGLAQGQALGYADTRPKSGLMDEAASKLQTLGMILEDTLNDLTSANTRLFGPRPPQTNAAGGARAPSINGVAGDLLGALDMLCERASAAREEARGINSRI